MITESPDHRNGKMKQQKEVPDISPKRTIPLTGEGERDGV